ncbi:MAG: 50S ribosomal protein L25/general stress protein Ctc [Proteobacteria bacterium]|nr:50S ribosomal protein L25/general stress protein Ctc [Pseudomonadota bacterium]MCL2308180.1 50S ribosomal protein L25/general stress protein Ctc [Pseudomonadota bacterium]
MEISAQSRKEEGRGASRRSRRGGNVPGIIYGGDSAPTPILLDHNTLYHALRKEAFHSSILNVTLDGKNVRALLRDVQMHPYKQQVLHVDFQRVEGNKKIHMRIPLHFINAEISPAVKLGGALINQVINELDISCLPKDLPEFIEVDLSEMQVGDTLHVSELKLPAGVTAVLLRGQDPTVASASVVKEVSDEEIAAAPGEPVTTAQAPAAKE